MSEQVNQPKLKSVNLNTQYRSNGSIASPSWILREQLLSVQGVKIKNCMVPLSFYTIDGRNNKIYFTENGVGAHTATIADGIYTASTFPDAIVSAMNSAGTFTYTCTIDTTTDILTIATVSGNFQINSGSNNAYYEMGITSDQFNSYASSISGSQVIDLSGVKIIHLVSPQLPCIKVVGEQYNILGSIILPQFEDEIGTYFDHGNDYIELQRDVLGEITISLYDNQFRQLTPRKDYALTLNFLIT